MFLYYRKNGVVVMRSEQRLDLPQFDEYECTPDTELARKIDENYPIKIRNNQIILETPEHVVHSEKIERRKRAIEKLKTMSISQDLKDIILSLTE